jgi:phosphatidylserine decarboxylase
MNFGRLFVWLQYLMPQHALSRLTLRATRVRSPWFKNWLVRGFLKLYTVDMTEAAAPDPLGYASFNEFFTRPLKPDARLISEAGSIEGDTLLQAKGRRYTLGELLAARPWANRFAGGSFATIYLAPFNYHRVHMPLRAQLNETVYVPGRLFSVNATTASHVPKLFVSPAPGYTC